MREFMFSDDCADAIVFLLENIKKDSFGDSRFSHINIGSGQEVSILELTKLMAKVIGYKGDIVQDLSKPDGAPRKLLDSAFLENMGWKPRTSLEGGIRATYEWFANSKSVRKEEYVI
jgi:GDP-L-fucose synthase